VLAYCNPLTYFVQTMRMVYLKGSTIADLLPQMGALCLFALLLFIWAIFSYRKRN
jgi:ABC-2 type transport system permease protein